MTGPLVSFRPLGDPNTHLWRLRRMARLAGCDLASAQARGDLPQETWAHMIHRCRGCTWTGCARWLDRADHAGQTLPPVCVNAKDLAGLAEPGKERAKRA